MAKDLTVSDTRLREDRLYLTVSDTRLREDRLRCGADKYSGVKVMTNDLTVSDTRLREDRLR